MRNAMWTTALGVLVVASGCGGESGPPEAESAEPSASETVEETPSEDPELTIRDFDFTTVTWREAISQSEVQAGEDDLGRVRSIGDVAYADVDGDGHEDALVGLATEDGNAYEQVFYIWTWDAEAEVAVQVENPIARESSCGDSVESIEAGDAEFVIHERVAYTDLPLDTCAEERPIEVTRKIALVDGWPALTIGQGGHGGICPQFNGTDDLWPLEDLAVHPGPREETGTLDPEFVKMFAEVDVWDHLWLFRENWMLVHVTPEIRGEDDGFAEYGDYVPCGWMFLEDDTRPIPH